jgi:4-alpha-glucanotransferase
MKPLHFALLVHAHQPLGNFDHVMEDSYRLSYLPFVKLLAKHPSIHATIHYSGSLLEWIHAHHPEYFELLREMVQRGQLEVLGGGYYEPILISIPDRDKHAQILKLSDYLERHLGRRPRGIWLTERVWEPALPQALARAGVAYTLTDDTHFLNAGLEPEELFGDYLTEYNGSPVRVIPGLKELRYLIPFRDVSETVNYLREAAQRHPGGLAAMGDDLEKFGVWPETYRHVYESGWLDNFFTALEQNSDCLRAVTAWEYLETHPPLGRVYLPTASYQEMMEWALPEAAEEAFERARHRAEELSRQEPAGADMLRFLRGGLWNNFFHKYSEANLLHKRMLWASRRFPETRRAGDTPSYRDDAAYDALLAGQCNDAYWHGVFGGLYAPHLRHALFSNLVKASRPAPDEANAGNAGLAAPIITEADFDLDGLPELVLDSDKLFVVIDPGDGATVPEIDCKAGAVNVVNSIMRRHESYHKKLQARAAHLASADEAASIHDRVRVKEEGLETLLIYDRYERSCFRTYLFDAGKTLADYAGLVLGEDHEIAAGPWDADGLVYTRGGLRKEFSMTGAAFSCRMSAAGVPARIGLELIFNLMAPDAHDRYFEADGLRQPLRWQGEIYRATELWLRDWYLDVAIHITVEPAATWWITPIYTVSQSEEGFEKVYQGSMIMPWWEPSGAFEGRVTVELSGNK